MSDSYIIAGSQKIDSERYTRGLDTIERQRGVLVNAIDPQVDVLSSGTVAAGASVDLDGTDVASGKTGFLMGALLASSVAAKWEVKKVDGVAETLVAVLFTSGLAGSLPSQLFLPSHEFHTLAYGNGDEFFRVTATNLDATNTAGVYATLYWDSR